VKFYLGVTDTDWYRFLRDNKTEDVNFWQPGGSRQFSAVPMGAPFLFKLKAPLDAIGGLGFFRLPPRRP
jgi:putative restriction endonuclease